MSKKLTLDIIRQLPKADLHCHLDGFVRPKTVLELAKEQGVELPTYDLDELTKILEVPMDCPDLVTYLKPFDITTSVMQVPYAITRILYESAEDAVKDGISYLELRFAPALHTQKGLSYSQIIEAAIDGCRLAEQKLPITVRIICCAMRHMDPKINAEVAEIVWRFRHNYVVGFDLAGPEDGFPPSKHAAAFRTIREKSISLTIHAGEAYGPDSVRQALFCGSQRIGHGTRTIEDPKVLQECIDRRITFECCVSSNVQTKAVKRFEDHPIKKYLDMGVRVVPCTDNPTVSNVTLSGEYQLIYEKYGFSVSEILRMMDNGFRAAFVPESQKKRLRIEAFVKAYKILQEAGFDLENAGLDKNLYSRIGLSVPPIFRPPTKIPPLTLSLVKQLPKADLDCRLIGAIPPPVMYSFYTSLPQSQKAKLPKLSTFSEFEAYLKREEDFLHLDAKQLSAALLQTESNLREGLDSLIQEALTDNVKYMEVTVSPVLHIQQGLSLKQVVEILLNEIEKFGKDRIIIKLVLNVNVLNLTPVDAQKVAELCVEFADRGVVGFSTTGAEITEEDMRYWEPTFEYLQKYFVPVTMFAGEEDPHSVPCALVRGHARRISGGFRIAQSDALLSDVSSHNVGIIGHLSKRFTENCPGYKKSPVRFFFDFGVKIAYASIHHSFAGNTRAQQLYEMATESGLDALSLCRIISNSFESCFLPYKEMKKLSDTFFEESQKILKDNGFTRFMNYEFF